MRKSKWTDAQIIGLLQEAEAGTAVTEICRRVGVSTETFYRWRKKFGTAASVRARAHRTALVGDAAGYVDAITGEGLSLGFEQARLLAEVLPDAVAHGATGQTLARYEEGSGRAVVDRLIAMPSAFGLLLRCWLGPESTTQ